jgi:hypothetical protein
MPRGDGTGPGGLGSMTGRGLGYCAGYSTPGYTRGPGMGLGRGFGRGRGRGIGYGRGLAWGMGGGGFGGNWGYNAPYYTPVAGAPPIYAPIATPESQLNMLKDEKNYLDTQLKGIQNAIIDIGKRIDELEKSE